MSEWWQIVILAYCSAVAGTVLGGLGVEFGAVREYRVTYIDYYKPKVLERMRLGRKIWWMALFWPVWVCKEVVRGVRYVVEGFKQSNELLKEGPR